MIKRIRLKVLTIFIFTLALGIHLAKAKSNQG